MMDHSSPMDQNRFLEEGIKKVKEQAFYMKHAMVSYCVVMHEVLLMNDDDDDDPCCS